MGESSMSEETEKPYDGEVVRDGATMASRLVSRPVKLAALVLVSQMVMTGLGLFYIKTTTPAVVTFDMKGTMDLFIQQTLAQKVPEEQSKVLMTRFNRAMMDSIQDWQDHHNDIILVRPAVVGIQKDITQEIRTDIAQRMQSGNEGRE
jgi:conjugal transfer pilin signal peptidase TrbI